MRDLRELDAFRLRNEEVLTVYGSYGDKTCGAFLVPHAARQFMCIASSDGGWDHVSVSLPGRCPSWNEMSFIKGRFFKPDELAMQLHLPTDQHINIHPYCLHLWRKHGLEMELPPASFV